MGEVSEQLCGAELPSGLNPNTPTNSNLEGFQDLEGAQAGEKNREIPFAEMRMLSLWK